MNMEELILSYYKLCLYFKLCLRVLLDRSSMFIYIHILSYYKLCFYFKLCLSVLLDSSSMFIYTHILSYYKLCPYFKLWQLKVKAQLVVRKDMDENEHERAIQQYT
jgi:hypothetical protein